ncbi:MAG TPA: glycosyltransferase, partial [Rhizomicrobium sp.]|nr:glycosyltransferase [Rhizomicrobium sp.]
GEIGDEEKNDFLGNALALVFPICWPEPFGLVMIEAAACGTPVIAFNCGSVAEVIEDGVTGFIVQDVASAARALGKVQAMDRLQIRRRFEQRFTVEQMTAKYLDVYSRLLEGRLGATVAA